ncbi:MAG: DUF5712 family protein [Cytophagales bacterium]|nr:DUF5712 family protein [Cytophagales bacterium]
MPYVKINGGEIDDNKGSCQKLVNYLNKENVSGSLANRTFFFSANEDRVKSKEVIQHIDQNVGQLRKDEAKFYMITLNFSPAELKHIRNHKEKIKDYTRGVMEDYDRNFKGRELKPDDIVWYTKIVDTRYYKGTDRRVKEGKAKQGTKKPGLNTHVHIIVSRKDRNNKLKLSPMTNHRSTVKGPVKGGFSRVAFKYMAIDRFDRQFNFKREINELKRYRTFKYGSDQEVKRYLARQKEKNGNMTMELSTNFQLFDELVLDEKENLVELELFVKKKRRKRIN